jgi:ubiquitin-like-conjugating enzyme ATG10
MSIQEALVKEPAVPNVGSVTYEIHLHPTYRMPCLWFSLNGLPPDEPAFDIDTVFRRLVPDQFKAGLRGLGGIGGLSVDVSSFSLLVAAVISQLSDRRLPANIVGLD